MVTLDGIRVVEEYLGDCYGFYDAATKTIVVDSRLPASHKRVTVMHEKIHAERGDYRISSNPHADTKQEYIVNKEVAIRLIDYRDLADGVRWCRNDQELAEQLEVDLRTLEIRFEILTDDQKRSLLNRD